MTTSIVTITPEIAKAMLSKMGNNRKVKNDNVIKLAKDMQEGNFIEGNDSICFDPSGQLINGQHRLLAVIKSGASIPMTVKCGVPAESVIDRLVARSTSDTWKMHGVVDKDLSTKECVSLVNAYICAKYGHKAALTMTDIEKEDFVLKNSGELKTAIKISHNGANHPIMKKAGVQATLFAALKAGVSEKKLYRFAECVNTMFYNGEPETAAIILRKYLEANSGRGGGGSTVQNEQISVTEQAIKDFTAGKSRRRPYKSGQHIYIVPESKETSNE